MFNPLLQLSRWSVLCLRCVISLFILSMQSCVSLMSSSFAPSNVSISWIQKSLWIRFFSAVALPDARAKAIPEKSQNVNCFPLERLALTVRKKWALLKETACLPSRIAINNKPYLFFFLVCLFCLLWIMCWFTVQWERECVLDNQQWLWLVFCRKIDAECSEWWLTVD